MNLNRVRMGFKKNANNAVNAVFGIVRQRTERLTPREEQWLARDVQSEKELKSLLLKYEMSKNQAAQLVCRLQNC